MNEKLNEKIQTLKVKLSAASRASGDFFRRIDTSKLKLNPALYGRTRDVLLKIVNFFSDRFSDLKAYAVEFKNDPHRFSRLKNDFANLADKTKRFFKAITNPANYKREKFEKLIQNLPEKVERLTNAAESLQKKFQKDDFDFYAKVITIVLCQYFLADVITLWLERFIPEPAEKIHFRTSNDSMKRKPTLLDYEVIVTRNLFNSQGLIYGESKTKDDAPDLSRPILTSLPLNLIGAMILRDNRRSLATLMDKSDNQVYAVQVGDEIPGKLKVTEVLASRVVFINLSSRRAEYVELPEDAISAPKVAASRPSTIEKLAGNRFNISRSEVDASLSDLNNVLTQARAIPNFENGVASGYKIFQIVPGSIYSKIGIQDGDILKAINGEPITDPGKAFQLLNELKTSKHLELKINRNGKEQDNSYDIN